MGQNKLLKWRGYRWLYGYLAFYLVAGGGAGILARQPHQGQGTSVSFVILILVVFFVWCAVNDREDRTLLHKVGWVIGLWIAHSLLSVMMFYGFVSAGILETNSLRSTNMLAGYVLLYFALRRSTVFVETTIKQ